MCDETRRVGQALIQSAAAGVSTADIEFNLQSLNTAWTTLTDRVQYDTVFTYLTLSLTEAAFTLHYYYYYSRLHTVDCIQSSCTGVYTGPHLHTSLTSFVRWQMSRLVSDSVPVHLHHWLSAAPTPYRQWPCFPGRRCTCLEQSAWSCHFRIFRSSLPVPA